MFLEDIQHSQPHMTFYREVVFLSWGGRILRKVESPMIILLPVSIASFSPPSPGGINMLLCSYLTETFNNNFGTYCFYLSSMET